MPKDFKSYYMVASHLYKNAHRFYKEAEAENGELSDDIKLKKEDVNVNEVKAEPVHSIVMKEETLDVKQEKVQLLVKDTVSAETVHETNPCKEVNKKLCEIKTLKSKIGFVSNRKWYLLYKAILDHTDNCPKPLGSH